jgi:hypothetical protein
VNCLRSVDLSMTGSCSPIPPVHRFIVCISKVHGSELKTGEIDAATPTLSPSVTVQALWDCCGLKVASKGHIFRCGFYVAGIGYT